METHANTFNAPADPPLHQSRFRPESRRVAVRAVGFSEADEAKLKELQSLLSDWNRRRHAEYLPGGQKVSRTLSPGSTRHTEEGSIRTGRRTRCTTREGEEDLPWSLL